MKGEGLEDDIVADIVTERGLRPLFSPREVAFIDDPRPSEHDRLQFVWRYEAAWVLLWALGWSEEPLALPREACDVAYLAEMVRDEPDLAVRGLRQMEDLLDATDLIFRCHWATRQARLTGQASPAALNPGVTQERHHALNWLSGCSEEAWDDVSTNT